MVRARRTRAGIDARHAWSDRGVKLGKVYLVGAGPGDPGLITVRGRELVDDADAVVYDALANRDLLPGDAKETGRPELYFVGKRGGDRQSATQEEINDLLVKLAREGKSVVRLKGGDPLVFGRGSEEAQALNDSTIPFEIVPGVTAGIAAPAYAGIPVTHRGIATSVTFVTGQEEPGKATSQTNWTALAKSGGTIVLYMGVKALPAIAKALIAGGMPPEIPAAAIQWGTHAKQRTVTATLESIAERAAAAGVSAPVITVIGYSIILRDEMNWFESRPLFGKRIVVTRAAARAGVLSGKLRELGADVIEMPSTRIARLDLTPLRAVISRLRDFQWVIFTSQNAVAIFWEQLLGSGFDARSLAHVKVCAVGAATAGALLEHGIIVDVVPERFVAESLLEKVAARDDINGSSVLYVTAEGAREVLRDGLAKLGASVTVVETYQSINDGSGSKRLVRALEAENVDLITFTSASAVRGYVNAVGDELAQRVSAASIGPITSGAIAAAGISLKCEAKESTIDGLVDAVQLALA
jgi:uroporphyrinogen III methyltransferase/synthase